MSTVTTFLNLVKPAPLEPFSRATYVNNLDLIDAGVQAITQARHVEFVRVNQADSPANTLWGPGLLLPLVDAAASKNYVDWATAGATDSIKLAPGVYVIDWKIFNNSGANVSIWHTICTDGTNATTANGTSIGRSPTTVVPTGDPFYTFGHIIIPTTATDVFFKFVSSVTNASIHHRIKITKIA